MAAESSSAGAGDRLSTLDLELRLHILSFLPYKSAVATSLLSSTWRHLHLLRGAHLRLLSPRHVSSFLSRPFLPPRVDSLHVTTPHPSLPDLLLLMDRLNLQDLSLSGSKFPILTLPSSLIRLSLSRAHLITPVKNLTFLEHLNLHSISLTDETLADTVSGLYVLKTLDLRRCYGLYRVRIPGNGLWLRNVVMVECPGVTSVKIKGRFVKKFHFVGEFCEYKVKPALEVEIEDLYMSCGGKKPMLPVTSWLKVLERPWLVRVLTLCDASLRHLVEPGIYRNFERLREVQLLMSAIDKQSLVDICSFSRLCRCPGLEKLFIEVQMDTVDQDIDDLADINEQSLLCSFDNLKIIKINRFKGHTYEMLLARIFLWKAVNLEWMLIINHPLGYHENAGTNSIDHRQSDPNLLHFLRLELSLMAKSSEAAKIVVRDQDDYRALPKHHEAYSKI